MELILNLNKMNCKITIPLIAVLLVISLLLVPSCKKASIPAVKTGAISRIQQTNAYGGGQITSDGGAHISKIGVCWSTTSNPTITDNKTLDSTSLATYTSHITGLTPNTMYYVKAYATNSEGTAYGDMVSFTTDEVALPTIVTSSLKSVTLTTAASGGEISNDGGLPVTARGVCWNSAGSPTLTDSYSSDGIGPGNFTSTLTDLTQGMTYHVRAYATNSLGTAYGNELLFTQTDPVLDQDGNAYIVVTIGTQVWLGENLKTTTLNDGTAIPNITSGDAWATTTTPAYSWYNNNESSYRQMYGALYNWYAVNTGKLCPVGWHVPTDEEYSTMIVYLGGLSIAGGKLKEAGTSHWADPNLGATNGSGFSALPGGGRYTVYSQGGTFSDLGYFGYFWSSTAASSASGAFSFDISYNLNSVIKSEYSRNDGGSVRCLKDSK
jgi:uncharacterized protein (TIGR02145 family)